MTQGEVLFEFCQIGNAVKVSAVHVDTGTEVAIVGAASMSNQILRAAALNKLKYVLEKQARAQKAVD